MLSSGIPGLSQIEDVSYIHEALLPNVSDTEATQSFTQYVSQLAVVEWLIKYF